MTLFRKEIALRFSDVNVITTLLIETDVDAFLSQGDAEYMLQEMSVA